MAKIIQEKLAKVKDWDRSDRAIAKDLGTTTKTVWNYRKEHGIPPFSGSTQEQSKIIQEKLAKVKDWDRKDQDIANDFGISATSVRNYRKEHGIPPFSGSIQEQSKIIQEKLAKVKDWNRSNKDIARYLGTHNSTVGNYRKEHGIPQWGEGSKGYGDRSLQARYPDVAAQWDDKKNAISPSHVRPSDKTERWWLCERHGSYQQKTVIKTGGAYHGCPICGHGWTAAHILAVVEQLWENRESLTPEEWLQFAATKGMTGQGLVYIKNFAKGGPPEERQKKMDQLREAARTGQDLSDSFLEEEDREEGVEERLTDGQDGGQEYSGLPGGNMQTDVDNVLKNLNRFFPHDSEHLSRYFIDHQVARLWEHAYRDCEVAVAEAKAFKGKPYPTMVRDRFLAEYQKSTSIKKPKGYHLKVNGKPADPSLMQWHVVQQVRDNLRVGNWSGTGSGKTLSAILSSVVIGSRVTLILCPTVVVDTWFKAIKGAFKGCEVKIEDWNPTWSQEKRRFLLFGYGKIQVPQARKYVEQMTRDQAIDMVVVDEIQYVKNRKDPTEDNDDVDGPTFHMDQSDLRGFSNRRQIVLKMVHDISAQNENLAVLGMSATPIVNNLQEGKSIIDIIMAGSKRKLLDLGTKSSSVEDCMAMHRQFVHLGTRYKQNFGVDINVRVEDVSLSEEDMDRLYEVKHNGWTMLGAERVLLEARLPVILQELKKGERTIVYTDHVDGIQERLFGAIQDAGFRVGLFTGTEKSGMKPFMAGKLDVLVASRAISTGIDGLQDVCRKIVISELPWTNAEFEQLTGRILRSGQRKPVEIVLILAEGIDRVKELWSADRHKWNRIQYKRTIADAVMDGVYPDANLISKQVAFKRLGQWLDELRNGNIVEGKRRLVDIPILPPVNEKERKARAKQGNFTEMNKVWNRMRSDHLHTMLQKEPWKWENYHTKMEEEKKKWKVVPTDVFIDRYKSRPGRMIGDFGCGQAFLANALEGTCTVHSFDHIACQEGVVACDMAHVPLDDESIDEAIFSLSMMGANWKEYIAEAYRVLRMDGFLWIVESSTSTHLSGKTEEETEKKIAAYREMLLSMGFSRIQMEKKWKFTFISGVKEE